MIVPADVRWEGASRRYLSRTVRRSGAHRHTGVARLALLAGLIVACLAASVSPAQAAFELEGFSASLTAERGTVPDTQAGSHPTALELSFKLPPGGEDPGQPVVPYSDGDLRDLDLELPPGLIENPTAVPTCSQADFSTPRSSPFQQSHSGESCPDSTQIGLIAVRSTYGSSGGIPTTRTFGLYNLAPPPGSPSEFGANPYGARIVFIPHIRQADGEYGLTLQVRNLSQTTDIIGLDLTIWGVPWGLPEPKELIVNTPQEQVFQELIEHDDQHGNCLNENDPSNSFGQRGKILTIIRPGQTPEIEKKFIPGTCSPSNALSESPTASLTLPTSCEELSFAARATSWQGGGATARAQNLDIQGCGALVFEPHPSGRLSDPRTTSPSGYLFEIATDDTGITDPRKLAPSPVRKAVVALPEGVTINPALGAGLGICTPAGYQAESPLSPPGAGCPNESKIGDFNVRSPLLAGGIDGSIYLAAPYDNPFSSLLAVYLVAKNSQRGFLVKLAGRLDADPLTGRLTATFDRLPQLPYSKLSISFREGQRSPLASPAICGLASSDADLSAWRDPNLVRHSSLPTSIEAGIGGGPCPGPLAPFSPPVDGGSLNPQAGAYSSFYLHFTRNDAEQEITSYSADFPPGMLGKLSGVPYCPDAAITAAAGRSGDEERDNPSCPAASRIGRTVSGYGVGSVLTYAPGSIYLAGPYHGSQVSVVAIDSALVGPFDLGTIVIRSAIRVDPTTARASIDATGTDPIPHIIKGIPIHLRDVRIYIDRPEFTLNPTNCEPSSISSALNGSGAIFGERSDDTLATAAARYQVFGCGSLGFRPRVSMRMRRAGHYRRRPSLRVTLRPRAGDANISSTQVSLPPSVFLNQANIRAVCTRRQFERSSCPPDSLYGHVRADTPLLDQPLEGPAYLRSSEGGLPDLVFALHGSGFEVDLAGTIDSAPNGGLRATFVGLPDAPVSSFTLNLFGGRNGILETTAGFCAAPQSSRARLVGQNNRGWISRPPLPAPCAAKKHRKKHRQDPR